MQTWKPITNFLRYPTKTFGEKSRSPKNVSTPNFFVWDVFWAWTPNSPNKGIFNGDATAWAVKTEWLNGPHKRVWAHLVWQNRWYTSDTDIVSLSGWLQSNYHTCITSLTNQSKKNKKHILIILSKQLQNSYRVRYLKFAFSMFSCYATCSACWRLFIFQQQKIDLPGDFFQPWPAFIHKTLEVSVPTWMSGRKLING